MSHSGKFMSHFVSNALLAAVVCGIIAGCAGKQTKPDDAPLPDIPDASVEAAAEDDTDAAPVKTPEERFAQALTLMKQRKTAQAEAAFMELAKDFPDATGPQTNLGIIFANTKRNDAAIAAFTRAASANGENASAFNWLGILNRRSGNFERAKLSFEKAIEVNPNYAAAHLNLGLLLELSMNQPADAVESYRSYQKVVGEKDLRVLPWIAEIEARQPSAQESSTPINAGQEDPK